jgi:hypothetical protein
MNFLFYKNVYFIIIFYDILSFKFILIFILNIILFYGVLFYINEYKLYLIVFKFIFFIYLY